MTELPEREDFGDYGRWPGRAVLDPTGRRLGEVREIYLDDATDRPEWVLVELGDEGPRFVPLADATVAEDAIKVAQDSDRVEAAPTLEPSKELTLEEERRLYSHYGLRYSEEASDTLLPDPDQPAAAAEAADATDAAEPDETPTAGSGPADAAPLPAASASAAGRPMLRLHVGAGPELPAAGETSEPVDTGPMIPPRPEPVAPPPVPAPEPGGALALVRRRPAPVAACVATVAAAIAVILLRRRRR